MRPTRREVLFAAAAPAFAKAAARRPNIVLVVADDLGAWMLGCYGNQVIRTPNIDLLARSGTRFLYHIGCAPAGERNRAALLTGRPPHQQGSQDPRVSDLLASAGYVCGSANALEFLDSHKGDQPFFLAVNQFNLLAPNDKVPAKYHEMYAQTSFDGLGWEPVAPNAARDKDLLASIVPNLRRCAAAITAFDDQIQPLVARLDQRGLRENTLIVFTSASGFLLGRHGLWSDGLASEPVNMYEEVMATPMIWNWRGQIPVEAARPELVSACDFLPTLCELTGVAPPRDRNLPGRSYLPAVFNQPFPKKQPWRNLVFGEFRGVEMARDTRYKLVLRNQGQGPNELFDLRADPREKVNQYANLAFVTMRDRLSAELDAWRKK
ncbi:MAG: sulfatase-like hydrolase/transferase [Bryobacteraceae bacterium]|jgi:arylsulfatase A-like enzyme